MHIDLPPLPQRVRQTVADDLPVPLDPVGTAVAGILVELLDGIVVDLSYAQPPDIPHQGTFRESLQTAVADRRGPTMWETRMVVNIAGGAAGLCAEGRAPPHLPSELAELPEAAFRAADVIAVQSGLDGKTITPSLQRALQESIVIEMLAGEVARLSGGVLTPGDVRELVGDIVHNFDRISLTKVEGEALSHGVVLRPERVAESTLHRYPSAYRQKRVPLLFDGRTAVLVIDAAGHAEFEVQRSRPDRRLQQEGRLRAFTEQLGEQGGSLVAATSRAYDALGFYAHSDGSTWAYSWGSPLIVRRAMGWRALPMTAITRGIGRLADSEDAGGKAVAAAVLLSLNGHGGVIAIANAEDDLSHCIQPKDRVDSLSVGDCIERSVHDVLDLEDVDVATLARIAAIDGATILSRDGRVLAYGAIVASSSSAGEGARTAAARTLSEHTNVTIKVSEDGPITVFSQGLEVAALLS